MKKLGKVLPIVIVLSLLAVDAFAGAAAPWDGPIDTFIGWMTGKFALGLSVVALLIAGSKAIFSGGELSGYAKTMLLVVIGASTIVSAVAVFNLLFTPSGALL